MQTAAGMQPTQGSGATGEGNGDDGVLVVVRPDVVETADHVLGNLFQRLYHGIERAGRLDPSLASELSASLNGVEEALQLVLDYVAPFPPVLARMPAADVLGSLVRNLAPGTEATLMALNAAVDGVWVSLDASRAARAIELLRQQLDETVTAVPRVRAALVQRQVVVTLLLPRGKLRARSSLGELRWAVSEKLIEMHGGTIAKSDLPAGEVEWRISLPSVG